MSAKVTNPDYFSLGDVCRCELGVQCQYGSRYAREGNAASHLRYLNLNTDCYHDILIHKDDVAEFVSTVSMYLAML